MIEVDELVRNKARVAGCPEWVDAVPGLVAGLARDWGFTFESTLTGGTEAYVAAVVTADGRPAALKVCIPKPHRDAAADEIAFFGIAGGHGCAALYESDVARGALLLERLGPSLHLLDLPIDTRHEIICAAVSQLWVPAPDAPFRTGAEKGRWLIEYVTATWEALDHPCSERAVDYAIACAERRVAAHDGERSVLVHGDAHQWNTLRTLDGSGFKLIDPDGLLCEPAYDLAIPMREDPTEGDLRERAARLASLTGVDATAIWEWVAIERVSTGLLGTEIDMQPAAAEMLAAAEACAIPTG